jgi:uncharacterized protein (DUF488 family)
MRATDCFRGKDGEKRCVKIFTIGHSTRPIDEFVQALKAQCVEIVIDVRTVPKSGHNPQYNSDALADALQQEDIGYEHMPGLGGLRHAKKDSINTGWQNASFRGFADYMQTKEFTRALDRLIAYAQKKSTVIMCAEAVPWRCHRSLIGDALLVRGFKVLDIMSKGSVREHSLTPFAEPDGVRVTYPGPAARGPVQTGTGKQIKIVSHRARGGRKV